MGFNKFAPLDFFFILEPFTGRKRERERERECLGDDLRRSVDSHVEDRMAEYTYPSCYPCRTVRISSGINEFLVTLISRRFRAARARVAWHARHAHNGRVVQHRRIIVARRAAPLIVLSCVSISMAAELHRPVRRRNRCRSSAAVIVRRGGPTRLKRFSRLSRHWH